MEGREVYPLKRHGLLKALEQLPHIEASVTKIDLVKGIENADRNGRNKILKQNYIFTPNFISTIRNIESNRKVSSKLLERLSLRKEEER